LRPDAQRALVVAHDALSIYWLDPAAGLLRPAHQVAPTWLSDQVGSWPIPIDSGLAGAVVRSGRAEMVNNAQLDPRSVYPPNTPDPPEHHQITIPLHVNDQVSGVFLMSRAVQSHMVAAKWGRIVNLSSTSALGNRGQLCVERVEQGRHIGPGRDMIGQ